MKQNVSVLGLEDCKDLNFKEFKYKSLYLNLSKNLDEYLKRPKRLTIQTSPIPKRYFNSCQAPIQHETKRVDFNKLRKIRQT